MPKPSSIESRIGRLVQSHDDDVANAQQTVQQAEAIRIAREAKREEIAEIIRADAAATAAVLVEHGKASTERVLGVPLGGAAKLSEVPFWIIGYSPKGDMFKPFFDPEMWKNTTAKKMGIGLNAAGDLIVFTDSNVNQPLDLVEPKSSGIAPDVLLVPTVQINENVTNPGNQQIVSYWREQFTDNLAERILHGNDPTVPDGIQRLDRIPRLHSWREQ